MATFELHHLSLGPRSQPSLFADDLTKEQWIRKAFGQRRDFDHRSVRYVWMPYGEASDGAAVVGVVEREYPIQHYQPPDAGGGPTVSDIWQGAVVTIDPLHHRDGQKLAFERGTKVGQPLAVLTSLVAAINELPEAPYIITVRAIWDEESFDGFARKHNNILRWVTFDFVVPNMFDLSGKLDEKLKQVGEDTGAKHVTLTLESPDGVKADAPEVQAGVAYGAKGQATVTARAMDGDKYSSTDKVRTSTVSSLVGQGKAILSVIRDKLDEVLGRDDADSGGSDSDSGGADRD